MGHKSYNEFAREERRLALLRILLDRPRYQLNSASLYHALDMGGINATRDDVRADLHWLAEQDLVTVEEVDGGPTLIATLTGRGQEVAIGKAFHPGVKRPDPA